MANVLSLQKMAPDASASAARWTLLSWNCNTENSTLSVGCY